MWQNYGSSSRLRVDGRPERRAFIGFDTSPLAKAQVARHESPLVDNDEPRYLTERQVLEAKLRLYPVDGGGGGEVYLLSNTEQWDETLVTATSLGNGLNSNGGVQLTSFGDVVAYEWQEIDVTEAFTGGASDFFTTFAIKSYNSDGLTFASRERAAGTLAPEIVITLSSAGAPTPSPEEAGWPTYAPTVITSEDPSPKPSQKPTQKPTTQTPSTFVTTIVPTKNPSAASTQMPKPEPTISPTLEPSSGITTKTIGVDHTKLPTPNPTFDSDLCQTCPPSWTLFVAGSNCSGFWRCEDGVRDQFHACPDGTIFNNRLQICDHPYNFTCTCNP